MSLSSFHLWRDSFLSSPSCSSITSTLLPSATLSGLTSPDVLPSTAFSSHTLPTPPSSPLSSFSDEDMEALPVSADLLLPPSIPDHDAFSSDSDCIILQTPSQS